VNAMQTKGLIQYNFICKTTGVDQRPKT